MTVSSKPVLCCLR